MTPQVEVDDEVYAWLVAIKTSIEAEMGEPASFDDAIRRVLADDRASRAQILQAWTRDQLVGLCRERDLMVSGSKDRLIARLVDAGEP